MVLHVGIRQGIAMTKFEWSSYASKHPVEFNFSYICSYTFEIKWTWKPCTSSWKKPIDKWMENQTGDRVLFGTATYLIFGQCNSLTSILTLLFIGFSYKQCNFWPLCSTHQNGFQTSERSIPTSLICLFPAHWITYM